MPELRPLGQGKIESSKWPLLIHENLWNFNQIYAGGGVLFAAGGGLFAGGPFAAGLIAAGLFASGLNAAPHA